LPQRNVDETSLDECPSAFAQEALSDRARRWIEAEGGDLEAGGGRLNEPLGRCIVVRVEP
jgi:hypothetical protein